ncbi:hypothetical protein [Streptomyces scabichelini]|uniref:hypothetical protein n=1 Tax=Streptomyces scabichelini TaxID=2711217 RepID=UPI0013ECDC50|nr:hypothetical protein [Streptomyces scabichelini]
MTTIPNAKVRAVAERVVQEFQLAADKVAAHHGESARFPMPSGGSATEHLLAKRFMTLAEGQKKEAAERVAADLKAGSARSKKLGDLAKVDLRSPTPVEAQVRNLPFPEKLKFPADELREVPASAVPESAQATTAAPLNKLELRIHRVRCLDETSDSGEDEIDLGGTCVDESGDVKKISAFRVDSFHTGEVQSYVPPRRFTYFSLSEGATFPKWYHVTLVLAEADWGGVADFLDDLLAKVKKQVVEAIAKAIGGALGSLAGPIGAAIGVAVGWAVTEIFKYLSRVWGDDVFNPVTVRVAIPSLTSRWSTGSDSPESTVGFTGHGGRYDLVFDWRMFA